MRLTGWIASNGQRAQAWGKESVCAWSRAPAAVLDICCTAMAAVLARGRYCLGSAKVYPAKMSTCAG